LARFAEAKIVAVEQVVFSEHIYVR